MDDGRPVFVRRHLLLWKDGGVSSLIYLCGFCYVTVYNPTTLLFPSRPVSFAPNAPLGDFISSVLPRDVSTTHSTRGVGRVRQVS